VIKNQQQLKNFRYNHERIFNPYRGISTMKKITLAIAGFKKSDIEIELEDGTLKITGTSNVLDTLDKDDAVDVEFLHKGIAERNFIRTFKLAEYVEVKDAKLEDGLLRVQLERNVPDAMKPQKIKIT
jgi:molecular chaperone IbpA